jgi:hypothetical protein
MQINTTDFRMWILYFLANFSNLETYLQIFFIDDYILCMRENFISSFLILTPLKIFLDLMYCLGCLQDINSLY